MKQYLDIVSNVLQNGKWKGNRTGIRTKMTFCEIFRHNMADGFPLLTTKKVAVRAMAVELEGFIKGITNKEWYQHRGCNIWNEWCNLEAAKEFYNRNYEEPYRQERSKSIQNSYLDINDSFLPSFESVRKPIQKSVNDLGPIYGYQWRNFNKTYINSQNEDDGDWNSYTDQLKTVIETLKTNPDDRRMVVSAWNPNQMHLMALPPCHYAFTLVHCDGVLNLCWKQRSCDLMLGVPFNIASYAMLLELLCKETGMIAGELVGVLEDCHIYENHIDGAKLQLQRKPHSLPKLKLLGKPFDIFNWTHKDFELIDYNPHEKIDFGGVAV